MEEKEKELNCWNHSVLEKSKREIASNKLFTLTFCLTLLKNQLFTKKRNRHFCRLPRSNTFWWESVWTSYSDDRFKQTFRFSRSTFTFVLSHIRHKLVTIRCRGVWLWLLKINKLSYNSFKHRNMCSHILEIKETRNCACSIKRKSWLSRQFYRIQEKKLIKSCKNLAV